uniref:Transmembrane protein n=1 Tax=Marseillevirus LCMAC101 TaxID=2506602 RepID=A0A481YRK8_9VIRU|nr:MAG: hypothetical protein LCMAC101_01950 [Marseillevirus LCMAC101]
MANPKEKQPQYVSPYNPATLPRWVWALFLGALLFGIILAMYLINKPKGTNPSVTMKQSLATSGIMGMPGAV